MYFFSGRYCIAFDKNLALSVLFFKQSQSSLLQPPLLEEHEIPVNFVVAPSTIQYDKN